MQYVSIELNFKDLASIEKYLIDSKGLYRGFFIFEGRKFNEKISLINKKLSRKERQELYGNNSTRVQLPRQSVKLCGYGMNDEMGPFLFEGLIEIFSKQRLMKK